MDRLDIAAVILAGFAANPSAEVIELAPARWAKDALFLADVLLEESKRFALPARVAGKEAGSNAVAGAAGEVNGEAASPRAEAVG